MEIYAVTVWHAGRRKPENWELESPPVRVEVTDSYAAAAVVAQRAGIQRLVGIPRPFGESGMFFRAPGTGLVFQVEDLNILRPVDKTRPRW